MKLTEHLRVWGCWSVGQARESMMELTQEVWWCLLVTRLAARGCTFSTVFMSFAVWALCAVSMVFLSPIVKFLLKKPGVLFALLVMVSM